MKNIFLLLLVLSVVIGQACKSDVPKKHSDTPVMSTQPLLHNLANAPLKQNDTSDMEILSALNCTVEYSKEDRLSGNYLDTITYVSRNYSNVLSKYSIDSLKLSYVINNLYPRSYSEFNCFYDSLTMSNGNRQQYFRRIDTLFVRYAAYDSVGCFQLLLNMTRFINPRKLEAGWLSGRELEIYYNVIPDNLYNFRNFYDTCDRSRYYLLPEWVRAYNGSLQQRLSATK